MMIDDGTYTAAVDRIEERIAVILLEDAGNVIEELHIQDIDRLPDGGQHEGAVLRVTLEENSVVEIEHESEAEQERRDRLREQFDRLSDRPPNRDS